MIIIYHANNAELPRLKIIHNFEFVTKKLGARLKTVTASSTISLTISAAVWPGLLIEPATIPIGLF
jgi:hypothetical protein